MIILGFSVIFKSAVSELNLVSVAAMIKDQSHQSRGSSPNQINKCPMGAPLHENASFGIEQKNNT